MINVTENFPCNILIKTTYSAFDKGVTDVTVSTKAPSSFVHVPIYQAKHTFDWFSAPLSTFSWNDSFEKVGFF